MPGVRRINNQPARLQDALVLHKYLLQLLGCKDLEVLSRDLKDPALEGVDDEGVSRLYYALKQHLYGSQSVTQEMLFEYDQNIVRYTNEINERRTDKIVWKYFQYLALLFTEIYLDRYFANKEELRNHINAFLNDEFNFRPETWHGIDEFRDSDMNKLAFWCATGSGKTLMMHINIKQYLHYSEKYHAKPLNRILILTPYEGLSNQHLRMLTQSNFSAELFSKQARGGVFTGKTIEVIDINKLADTDGDKTVAVESFEGNNLVLVDEGHKGSGGDVWKGYRNVLTQEGFSFEYSATFGQAIAAQSGTGRDDLLKEYGKATLFDYSYRYFYNDGYGKDYRIMNMASWDDEELFNMYLTAYLLCLYEQTLVYESTPTVKNRFLIAKPLGIFVGGSVNAVKKVRGQDVSDVVQILLFLQAFIEKPQEFIGYIKRLMDPSDGIKNPRGYSLFANSFTKIKDGTLIVTDEKAGAIYKSIISTLFHSTVSNAHLYLDKQKSGDKEIGLRIGTADYFGVINVGDSDSLMKLCENSGLNCETKEFGSSSLFSQINDEDSTINILIGSKKFSEGWSSWRVSAMGLMNVGRSEGSEIIQLFGRGVRLKGYKYSLKRSNALDSSYNPGPIPKGLREIEMLNIFGVRADYMDTFRKYLEDEGLPSNEDSYTQVQIPTVNLLGDKKLKIVRVKSGYDFKKMVVVKPETMISGMNVKVDWLPKVDAIWSERAGVVSYADYKQSKLRPAHINLLNWNRIFFAIEQMKNERGWYNMEISKDSLYNLMLEPSWYELTIQDADLEFHDFGRDVARWEEITIALLRGFIERAYKRSKSKWESNYMETVYIDPSDPNFFDEYIVEVRNDQQKWIDKLKELREKILSGNFDSDFQINGIWIQALRFDRHLFYPILCLRDRDASGRRIMIDTDTNEPLVKISPVALNNGETTFVCGIRDYYNANKDGALRGKEVYLLRNESRKGIGFFEASNFYPDFILWVNDGQKQKIVFIDPKGIRNLRGIEDAKIQLYNQLKNEIEPSLNDPDITLDSYIISNTKYDEVSFWGSKARFTDNHVIFQNDSNYIDTLFSRIL